MHFNTAIGVVRVLRSLLCVCVKSVCSCTICLCAQMPMCSHICMHLCIWECAGVPHSPPPKQLCLDVCRCC